MSTTYIAPGIIVEGELVAEEPVEVAGTFKGRVESRSVVTISRGSVVEAEIAGVSVIVAGQVTGDVSASERIDLESGSRLVGDVRAARLTIADGASFKGNVDMDV